MLSISSWNINSVNAHLEQLSYWNQQHNCDIILLQETKCENTKFPYQFFEQYNISHSGQKTYNGVAILSKYILEDIEQNFPGNPCPEQARFIKAIINTPIGLIKVINVYVPNGSEIGCEKFQIKLAFLRHLSNYLINLEQDIPTIIGADFNVAPFDIDVYLPENLEGQILFSIEEKALMRRILNSNFFDLYRIINQNRQEFSWWDYRKAALAKNQGYRIDALLGNPRMCNMLKSSSIDTSIRNYQGKSSDHAPVNSIFNI